MSKSDDTRSEDRPPLDPLSLRVDAARSSLRTRLFGSKEEAPRIGRFQILRQVGVGGMGTVFAAYDDTLERKVAVKVLSRTVERSSQARLLREAQSMARLRHPNVVQIYEVGEHGSELYIAMEFVDGQSLEAWQAQKKRPWSTLVDAYVQAGRGLAAAHAVGLVHRDFKPQNAMVEQRPGGAVEVRVLDFGLARSSSGVRDDESSDLRDPTLPAVRDSITMTGKAVGTPAYMAPEQIRGLPVHVHADQFALCVALWEALHGQHPFAADTVEDMFARVVTGQHSPPSNTSVPRRITAALERGLAPEPEDRWPSVRALVDVLARDSVPGPYRWALGLGGVLLIGGLATAALQPSTPPEVCTGAEAQLSGIWDEARRHDLQTAVLASALPYAETTWRHTADALSTYAEDWKAMHTEVCRATTVRGEQSAEVMQQRMRCLHRAKTGLQAATAVLTDADADVVENAPRIAAGLPPLDRCADLDALDDELPAPPSAEADAVDAIEALVARSRVETSAGHYPLAQQLATDATRRAAELTYEPIRADIALARGFALDVPGVYGGPLQPVVVEASYREALRLSLKWNRWESAHLAATRLIDLVGGRWGNADEALRYREVAEGLIRADARRETLTRAALAGVLRAQRKPEEALVELRAALASSGQTRDVQMLQLRGGIADALLDLRRCDEAEAELREALPLHSEVLGPDHPSTGTLRSRLGSVLMCLHRSDEAETTYREAVASLTRALGSQHLSVAGARIGLGAALGYQGKDEQALAEFRRVMTLHERRLQEIDPGSTEVLRWIDEGEYAKADAADQDTRASYDQRIRAEYRSLGTMYLNSAESLLHLGQFAEAEAAHRRELALLRRAGAEPGFLANVWNMIGYTLSRQDRYEDALRSYRRAHTELVAALGPHDPAVSVARSYIGDTLMRQGDLVGAQREFREALAGLEAAEASARDLCATEAALATVSLRLGNLAPARSLAERSWDRAGERRPSPTRATSGFALAQVRWRTSPDATGRNAALDLARDALAYFSDRAEFEAEAIEIRNWLRTRAPAR